MWPPEVSSLASETAVHEIKVVVCRWSSKAGHTASSTTSDTVSMLVSPLLAPSPIPWDYIQ